MTNKARELLERALWRLRVLEFDAPLQYEIETYIAEPEVKRERLSEKEIETEYWDSIKWTSWTSFLAGVRFAEKHHGIGEE